jgi:hypothetical protein
MDADIGEFIAQKINSPALPQEIEGRKVGGKLSFTYKNKGIVLYENAPKLLFKKKS